MDVLSNATLTLLQVCLNWLELKAYKKGSRWEKSERSKCLQLAVVISTCLFAYKLKTRHIKYQFVQVRKISSRRWSMRLISVNNIFHWVVFSFLPLSCYIHICWSILLAQVQNNFTKFTLSTSYGLKKSIRKFLIQIIINSYFASYMVSWKCFSHKILTFWNHHWSSLRYTFRKS